MIHEQKVFIFLIVPFNFQTRREFTAGDSVTSTGTVSWFIVLSLMALSESISVYVEPSFRNREP